jgi:hypothetical protein
MRGMGLLSTATTVDARTGRKTSNALTLTFRVGEGDPIAVASQAGGIGVLLGFKNGGKGSFAIKGPGGEATADCQQDRTTMTAADGRPVGTIDEEGNGSAAFRDADGKHLATWQGYPYEDHRDATWPYALLEPDGTVLGTLRLLRTSLTFDLVGELIDTAIWWDRAGQGMKVPTLGARLDLAHPVADDLGDLLLAACVDATIGPHDHLRKDA